MKFESVLELYLAVQNAYASLAEGQYKSEATRLADANYQFALDNSDFVDSEFYDYCEAEGLFEQFDN